MGSQYEGTVLSFNHAANWGFISSPVLQEVGLCQKGKGIFFHGKDVGTPRQLVPGEAVSFIVSTGPSGKPQAQSVQALRADGDQVHYGGPRYVGTVTTWSAKDGFGFVNCPDITPVRYAHDVFFHQNDFVTQGSISKGVQIAFFLEEVTATGKPQARQIEHLSGSDGFSEYLATTGVADANNSKIQGTILSYNGEKAWGFVTAPGLDSLVGPGKGVFFHIKDFVANQLGDLPQAGMAITFEYMVDPTGKPKALAVTPYGQGYESMGGGFGQQQQQQQQPAAQQNSLGFLGLGSIQTVGEGERIEGHIMSFAEEKAWGFLSAPALESILGRGKGIFFHVKDFQGDGNPPRVGQPVSFSYSIDHQGKPHAQQVMLTGGPPQGGKGGFGGGGFGGMQNQNPMQNQMQNQGAQMAKQMFSPDEVFTGSVQTFSEQKAWGFLTSPALEIVLGAGKGVFFHLKDVIGSFAEGVPRFGSPVSFTVSTDTNGKLHAKNVQPLNGQQVDFGGQQAQQGMQQQMGWGQQQGGGGGFSPEQQAPQDVSGGLTGNWEQPPAKRMRWS